MIYTQRLIMRPLTLADAPFMLQLLNDSAFITNIGDRGVRTVAEAEAYLSKGPLASYQQYGFGLRALELQDNQQLIGICGLIQRDILDAPDLGFALLPDFIRQGYAYEAAKAALQWAVALKIARLYAIVSLKNEPSQRLLAKLGFSNQGVINWQQQEVLLYQLVLPGCLQQGAR
jgi:ribosomal-protein-alanine N-acetyltransferase